MNVFSFIRWLVFLIPPLSSSAHVCLIGQLYLPYPSDPPFLYHPAQNISTLSNVRVFKRDILRRRFHGPQGSVDGALLGSSQPGIDQSLNVSDLGVDWVAEAADVLPVFAADGLGWVLGAEEGGHAAVKGSLYQVEDARHADAEGG